jgi:phosphatidylglycerophosphate synthase
MKALVIGTDDGIGARLRELGLEVEVVAPGVLAERVRSADGELVLADGDIATNREALAGLIDDPRIASGVLAADDGQRFLGVLKVAAEQRVLLAETADRAASSDDALAAIAAGLAEAGVPLRTALLRGMVWERPATEAAWARAAQVDEDRVRMDSAVKSVDGFFTTFFVSPYSRYVARWAAHRGLTPNQVTAASLALGLLSALCFATGERWGLIAGAVLLQVAFTADCVDGQLARYTRNFSALGGWLDSTFDRLKEWLIFAGLAIGADRMGHPVWVLAGAALTLQMLRHMVDFAFHDERHARIAPAGGKPAGELGRWGELDRVAVVPWVKRLIAFPIGERFALVSLTAALWSAHTTFVAWLAWGGFAALYGVTGRVLRALRWRAGGRAALERYRDDGPIARVLGPLGVRVEAPLLALAAFVPLVVAIAITGAGATNATAVAVIAWAIVIGGLSGGRTGLGRLAWTVPPLLRATEYIGLLWLGALAGASSRPAAFALLATLALRQYDIVYGLRYRGAPVSDRLGIAAGGWDGRLALGCVLLVTGALPAGFYALAAIIAVVFGAAAIRDWSRARMPVAFHDDKEDVEA